MNLNFSVGGLRRSAHPMVVTIAFALGSLIGVAPSGAAAPASATRPSSAPPATRPVSAPASDPAALLATLDRQRAASARPTGPTTGPSVFEDEAALLNLPMTGSSGGGRTTAAVEPNTTGMPASGLLASASGLTPRPPLNPTTRPEASPTTSVPTATTRAAETPEQIFDRVYGARYKKGLAQNQRQGTLGVAQLILKDVGDDAGKLTLETKVYLVRRAYEISNIDCTGYPTAIAATQLLMRLLPQFTDDFEDRLMAIYDAQAGCPNQGAAASASYFAVATRKAEEKLAAGRYEDAIALYQRIMPLARRTNRDISVKALNRISAIRDEQALHRDIEAAKFKLNRAPTDVKAANEVVGRLLLDVDQPAEAIKYTAQADAQTAQAADLANKDPAVLTEADMVTLAGWYRKHADDYVRGRLRGLSKSKALYEQYFVAHKTKDVDYLEAKAIYDEVCTILPKEQAAVANQAHLTNTAPPVPVPVPPK